MNSTAPVAIRGDGRQASVGQAGSAVERPVVCLLGRSAPSYSRRYAPIWPHWHWCTDARGTRIAPSLSRVRPCLLQLACSNVPNVRPVRSATRRRMQPAHAQPRRVPLAAGRAPLFARWRCAAPSGVAWTRSGQGGPRCLFDQAASTDLLAGDTDDPAAHSLHRPTHTAPGPPGHRAELTDRYTGAFPTLSNYQYIVDRTDFTDAFVNTIGITLMSVTMEMTVGLILALMLARQFRGRGLFRTIILTPMRASPRWWQARQCSTSSAPTAI